MPPAAKRRKISPSSKNPLNAPAAQRSIQAFGKIPKSQAPDLAKGIFGRKKNSIDTKRINTAYCSEDVKKPKLNSTFTEEEEEEVTSSPGKQQRDFVLVDSVRFDSGKGFLREAFFCKK